MKIKSIFLLIPILFIIASCNNDVPNLKKDLSNTPKQEVSFKRYEKALFALNRDSFIYKVPKLKNQFPLFLSENTEDTLALLSLKAFFTDHYMIELNDMVQDKYSDMSYIESELSSAVQYYHYYFDLPKEFNYYTYISGLDIKNPIKIIDSNIVVGLDLFLGEKSKVYSMSGFPKYKSKWLVEQNIVPSIMREVVSGIMPERDLSLKLIDQMIYEGKKLFFIQSMMPEIADTLLMQYSKSQIEWCYENEARLWSLMVENQFLFGTDISIQKKFMDDAPFTSILSTSAPARLGPFLGWRIVSKFMANSDYDLARLLAEDNAQLILKKSKYKPKR